MKRIFAITVFLLSHLVANAQIVKYLILISIDGMHPDMYLDKSWPASNLQQLTRNGTFADHMVSVFPAYTYPSHTAMLTGALPARSKIVFNQPIGDKSGNWNWYAKYIKVPTIWQALHKARMKTAAVMWPGTVGADIDYNLSEIWDNDHPDDRATEVRKHTTPAGLYEEIEQNATGRLDSNNMNDNYFSLDENAGRMAAYIFKKYKPNLLALHFATVDGFEHEYGRDADSVRLAVETDDTVIGDVLQAVEQSGLKDSTTVIIVGDHGFSNINQIFRPNMLIKNVQARFIAAGGSAFLYRTASTMREEVPALVKAVIDSLDKLPADKRKLFRIVDRKELDDMGADSNAILALAAQPGLVFSGAVKAGSAVNNGPGTSIQQNSLAGVFVPTHGGHHGYDPNIPDMYTGFIAEGAGIVKGGHIHELRVTDIAPLIAKLLGIQFNTPDGKLPLGVLKE
ncbi:MAG TPA: ectonucleotide pyrophosphatase/phosphodiesterase [Mucilaginibacter sp.]|jgi:predicted AlkP superfamily pyrophosphatase or phosphodiesterase|nr:ectonucleotide pyrophosphatase/phosphodiesterase [Mucilaginibacter sp.]